MNIEPIVRLFGNALGFINAVLVPFIFAIAFIAFLWGVFQYFIAGAAKEENRETGRQFVMWSVIGFAVMFSLWGIVNLLVYSAGFGSQTRPDIPQFDPTPGQAQSQKNSPFAPSTGSNTSAGANVPKTTGSTSKVCGGQVFGSCPNPKDECFDFGGNSGEVIYACSSPASASPTEPVPGGDTKI